MTEVIGWNHPEDTSDQWDGFNDSGIEHFRGSPILHLAREINQNSLDAGISEPVTVRFKLTSIPTDSIPHIEQLRATIDACSSAAQDESEKASSFFLSAKKLLADKKLPVLQISDYNTRGVSGPCENGYPYYALMKASGQSKKESDTAGGSYGIGKYAPYAVSALRTVFVSTVYQSTDGTYEQLTQGKSVLMSHDIEGKRKRGVGFWGIVDRCQPVAGVQQHLPKWIQRAVADTDLPSHRGTTISILGFLPFPNWQNLLAASVAENFFGAIQSGNLVVKIDDVMILDKGSIAHTFVSPEIKSSVENEKDEPEKFDNCRNYLSALAESPEIVIEETENRELGRCQLRIWVSEGLPKKVCVLRNGMFITDHLHGLKRFSDYKEFVAVVQCLSTKGNELLRAMEPPRHDDFEPARLTSKDDQRRGAKALKELSSWVRDMLKRHARDPVSEVTSIDELSEFFGDEDESSPNSETGQDVNPSGKIVIRAKPLPSLFLRSPARGNDEQAGDDGSDRGESQDSGTKGGSGPSATGESRSGATRKHAPLINVRAVPLGARDRAIAFTPSMTGKYLVILEEAGADADFLVRVDSANVGVVKDGGLEIELIEGRRVQFVVSLAESFTGALKVTANEI